METTNKCLVRKFAWLPLHRWVSTGKPYYEIQGFYWMRYVMVMKAGLGNEWTAYARYNDE